MRGFLSTHQSPDTHYQGNQVFQTIEISRKLAYKKLTWNMDSVIYHTVTQNDVSVDT
jgi:hypothetical protein